MRLFRIARRVFPARARARARAALFRWLDLSWTTPSGVLLRVENYDEWIIHEETFVDGEYDAAIALAIGSWDSSKPLRAIDLGANVGFFVLRLADRLHARGHDARFALTALEPRPDSAAQFRRRVFDDNGFQAQVTLVEGLAGLAHGHAELGHGSHPGGSSIMKASPGPSVAVPFVDLEALVAGDAAIDLLKCDIEGAELLFIEHQRAVLQKTRVLVIELHDALCDTARCRQLLATLGFEPQPGMRAREGLSIYLGIRRG